MIDRRDITIYSDWFACWSHAIIAGLFAFNDWYRRNPYTYPPSAAFLQLADACD